MQANGVSNSGVPTNHQSALSLVERLKSMPCLGCGRTREPYDPYDNPNRKFEERAFAFLEFGIEQFKFDCSEEEEKAFEQALKTLRTGYRPLLRFGWHGGKGDDPLDEAAKDYILGTEFDCDHPYAFSWAHVGDLLVGCNFCSLICLQKWLNRVVEALFENRVLAAEVAPERGRYTPRYPVVNPCFDRVPYQDETDDLQNEH